uniref:YqaJ-like recombinase domain protein n=1 Tax=Mimivirus LCMiAC02 TaxID=2506609 RepID=A0A481Z1W8_9VIRU|nr:MAG: YqaJ-like recombinase domain protein [Mimivirus LCMiAC02]
MIASDQKKIREILRNQFKDVMFQEEELFIAIDTLIIQIQTLLKIDVKDIIITLSYYLRRSQKEKKYYFNPDRKNVSEKYKNLLSSNCNEHINNINNIDKSQKILEKKKDNVVQLNIKDNVDKIKIINDVTEKIVLPDLKIKSITKTINNNKSSNKSNNEKDKKDKSNNEKDKKDKINNEKDKKDKSNNEKDKKDKINNEKDKKDKNNNKDKSNNEKDKKDKINNEKDKKDKSNNKKDKKSKKNENIVTGTDVTGDNIAINNKTQSKIIIKIARLRGKKDNIIRKIREETNLKKKNILKEDAKNLLRKVKKLQLSLKNIKVNEDILTMEDDILTIEEDILSINNIDNSDSDSDSELNSVEIKKLRDKFLRRYKYRPQIYSKKTNKVYKYPIENKYTVAKKTTDDHGPYGTQWVHEPQIDDELSDELKNRAIIYKKLRAIEYIPQRSKKWFKLRMERITASDGGIILDVSHYDRPYKFILKKVAPPPFNSNKPCYHGKKLEEPATMIYAYRMNVTVEEFGLMSHLTINILGASPDGICNKYKLDGETLSKYVGRMLEIKCPYSRKIEMDGPIYDHICPKHYWVQVQLQLECCNLEECDFWQCNMKEYLNRNEFMKDTDPDEPFRSLEYGYEKGCLIQLYPISRIEDKKKKTRPSRYEDSPYEKAIYADAIFIYPKKIEMSPHDCDTWVSDMMDDIPNNPKYKDYVFDKVLYWKLIESKNVTIKRDRKWFNKNFPNFEKMWNYVTFLRKNDYQLALFVNYVNSRPIKYNKKIMKVLDDLFHTEAKDYDIMCKEMEKEIGSGKVEKDMRRLKRENKKLNKKKYKKEQKKKRSTYYQHNMFAKSVKYED